MTETGLVSSLNIVTLVAILVIAAGLFLYFLRKRSNRHPMDTPEGKEAEEMRRQEAEEERKEEGRPKI
ncbi:LPXTG cell wall anchor domain-containing protein [Aurantiacibacter odishensis]|uniref:LPXTG cell wall anchor domain-containing protein n=1 Tax=Aurantiacibacter odishensis TaxID=1155476 RepID=UPI0013C46545|nr:LPXTG cell wall anchor domain-containing protein [Aurantiacibacter odishensis]